MFNSIKVDEKFIGTAEDSIRKPVIIYVNKFDEDAAKKFYEDFERAHVSCQEVIPIIIDSYGGYVDSLSAMIDVIETSSVPVATIAIGKAMSCGSILLSCGSEGLRFASSNARIMIHHMSSASWGKVQDMKTDISETERLQKQMFYVMAKNCKKPKNYFLDLLKKKGNTDWYLTPKEAIKHNLVNKVKVPKFQTTIKVTSKLI